MFLVRPPGAVRSTTSTQDQFAPGCRPRGRDPGCARDRAGLRPRDRCRLRQFGPAGGDRSFRTSLASDRGARRDMAAGRSRRCSAASSGLSGSGVNALFAHRGMSVGALLPVRPAGSDVGGFPWARWAKPGAMYRRRRRHGARVSELLAARPGHRQTPAIRSPLLAACGELEMRGVTFAYPTAGPAGAQGLLPACEGRRAGGPGRTFFGGGQEHGVPFSLQGFC